MRTSFHFAALLALLAGLLAGLPAHAQQPLAPAIPGRTYEFMTMTLLETPYAQDMRLLLTPAFQGRAEVKLEEIYNLGSDKYREHLQHNTLLVSQTLGELSGAGWELVSIQSSSVSVPSPPTITRYLLRKARP